MRTRLYKSALPVLVSLAMPLFAFAAVTTFKGFANVFIAAVKGLINIMFIALSVGITYGVVLYFMNSDNEKKREQIKGYLLWAVIGVIVTFGMWGLVGILCDTLSWCVVGVPYISPPA